MSHHLTAHREPGFGLPARWCDKCDMEFASTEEHEQHLARLLEEQRMKPVPAEFVKIATDFGLVNADTAALACRSASPRLPYWAACALLEKESGGRNVYGHDRGGVFSNDEYPEVTGKNFLDFLVQVMNGATSNGVGPCQITYAGSLEAGHRDGGYFREMAEGHLRPWVPLENMLKGFSIMATHRASGGSWRAAGTAYNGSPVYGIDYVRKCNQWRDRFGFDRDVG